MSDLFQTVSTKTIDEKNDEMMSDLFQTVSTKTIDEEYIHLENSINKFKNIMEKDDFELFNFLTEMNSLIERYNNTFIKDLHLYLDDNISNSIQEGTKLYLQYFQILKNKQNKEYQFVYSCVDIGHKLLKSIKNAVDDYNENDSDNESFNYDSY